jgi:hypothetical protein
MKQAIKEILLAGGKVSFGLKYSIDEAYTSIEIYSINVDSSLDYIVEPHVGYFTDIDKAIDFFVVEAFTSKNVGYLQKRLQDRGILFDVEDLSDEILNLFDEEGKLVAEEFKNKFGNV